MDLDQYEAVRTPLKVSSLVSALDLADIADSRTLLLGYTADRETWHIYLLGGQIHRHIYTSRGTIDHEVNTEWDNADAELIPSKRLFPERCDFEFVSLLREKGYHLPFTTFNVHKHTPGQKWHGVICY